MTVASSARKQQFSLDGTASTLTFTFRALVGYETDIKVKVTDGDGVDTDLTYTIDYTVSINSNGVGGVVTLVDAEAVGSGTATVYRDTTDLQASDYEDYGQFPSDTVETDLDKRTLKSQEVVEMSGRALQLPITYSGTASTVLPTPVASKWIGWNSVGNALENKTAPEDVSTPSVTSGSLVVLISGGGSAITTGKKAWLALPFDCTVKEWTLVADQTGDIVIDINRSTYAGFPTTASICGGSSVPTLSDAQKNQDTDVTDWTDDTLDEGDILEFEVDSAATVTTIALTLKIERT